MHVLPEKVNAEADIHEPGLEKYRNGAQSEYMSAFPCASPFILQLLYLSNTSAPLINIRPSDTLPSLSA